MIERLIAWLREKEGHRRCGRTALLPGESAFRPNGISAGVRLVLLGAGCALGSAIAAGTALQPVESAALRPCTPGEREGAALRPWGEIEPVLQLAGWLRGVRLTDWRGRGGRDARRGGLVLRGRRCRGGGGRWQGRCPKTSCRRLSRRGRTACPERPTRYSGVYRRW